MPVEYTVVLVEPEFEGNVGSVARAMKNFGFPKLMLVNPPELGGEARAMAMHGFDLIEEAEVVDSFAEVDERFDFLVGTSAVVAGDKNSLRVPLTPDQINPEVEGKVALIFGREKYGLHNEEIKQCDILLTIPAANEYPTLNLAQSVVVILYEISKTQHLDNLEGKKFEKANRQSKKVMRDYFNQLVDAVLYQNFERRIAKKTFQQLAGRSFISGKESYTLIGVFRKAAERLQKQKSVK